MNQDKTTGQVLARLRKLGLYVTPTMIEDDTAAHYLPARDTIHRGRAGASGLWEPWMERRAERLYRLRALDRRTGRGPSGSVLRLFLLFADAWGWEYVKETCIRGYQIALRGSSHGVKNRLRGKPLTLENLHEFAEDIAEEQYKPQDPNQAQIDRVKMTIGLLLFGVAPDGKMGTLEQITNDLVPDADADEIAQHKQLAPLTWTMLMPSEPEAIQILRTEVTDALLKEALPMFRGFLSRVRTMLRRKIKLNVGDKRPSLNPLSGFGVVSDRRFNELFRQMPIRATPAQVVGGQFAQTLIIANAEERLKKSAEFLPKWLAFWLQSEACAQWIQRVESE